MNKEVLETIKKMTKQDYDYLNAHITRHYKTSSIQYVDSVRDAVVQSAEKSSIDANEKERLNEWQRVFALFNNDYISLGLFAEEHIKETYTADGTAEFSATFYDVEINDKNNAEDEVGEQLGYCSVDVDTGECEGDSYSDFSIHEIKTNRTLESWETIQKDYNIPKEQQSETKEVA